MNHAAHTAAELLSALAAPAADAAVKATLLLGIVLVVCEWMLYRHPFAQAAVYRAALAGLVVLPLGVFALPRLQVPLLRAEKVEARGGRFLEGESFPTHPHEATGAPESLEFVGQVEPSEAQPAATPIDGTRRHARRVETKIPAASGFAWPAALIIGYLVGVVCFLLRIVSTWLALGRLKRARPLPSADPWAVRLDHWRRQLGVGRPVTIACCERTPVPIVIGWFKPMILLPSSLMKSSAERHRDAVLVHELCHVRRGDYASLVVLRLVQAVYWFHPLAWVLGRRVAATWERVCDALSVHYLGGSKAYRATLTELAAALVRRPKAALGLATVRSPRIARRLARLEQVQGRPFVVGRKAHLSVLVGVVVSAALLAVLEPTRRLAAEEPAATPATEGTAGIPPDSKSTAPASRDFTGQRTIPLRVITRDTREPIADAQIRVWAFNDEQTLHTDDQGRAELRLRAALFRYGILTEARKDGFVPKYASWRPMTESGEIPGEQLYTLEPGSEIGGAVQSGAGEAIAGAQVVIRVDRKNARSISGGVPSSVVKTDENGRWHCATVPTEFEQVTFRISHPDYLLTEIDGAEAGIAISSLRDRSAKLVMKGGVRVQGRVLDPEGRPVEGAEVRRLRSAMDVGIPAASTDSDGRFRLTVEEPSPVKLLIKSAGHAPAVETVEAGRPGEVLTVRLKPGHVIEGRVTDSSGKPLTGARVGVDEWRGQRGLYWQALCDDYGRFRWEAAPDDVVLAEFLHPGMMTVRQQPLQPGKDYVIALSAALRLRGKVVDADTGAPVSNFEVFEGVRLSGRDPIHWQDRGKAFTDGQYDIRFDYPRDAHAIRVEADGYRPVASRKFRDDEGDQVLDFRLRKDEGWKGIARLPDGQSAAGATMFIATPGRGVSVFQGKVDSRYGQGYEGTEVGDDGSYAIPPQAGDFRALFLSEQGYADVGPNDLTDSSEVFLQPWGRIEGTARIGTEPAVGVEIKLLMNDPLRRSQRNLPSIGFSSETTTDENGHYRLDWVPTGEAQVYLALDTDLPDRTGRGNRRIATQHRNISTRAGETTHLDLGGAGRPVTGKLVASGTDQPVDWTNGLATVRLKQPEIPYPGKLADAPLEERRDWLTQWQESPEGKARRSALRFFSFVVTPDGSFRIDDVPAGTYRLNGTFFENATSAGRRRNRLGTLTHEFTVPEMPGGRSNELLDLGMLEIELLSRLEPGDPAPAFEVETLDGDRLALEDYRGKFVLLDFWATWCGPCLKETPHLKAVYERFGHDERFAMIGLSLDSDREAPQRYVAQNRLAWEQGFVAKERRRTLLSDYGAAGIPQIVLVGPGGKIVANNLRGEQIAVTVEAALQMN